MIPWFFDCPTVATETQQEPLIEPTTNERYTGAKDWLRRKIERSVVGEHIQTDVAEPAKHVADAIESLRHAADKHNLPYHIKKGWAEQIAETGREILEKK